MNLNEENDKKPKIIKLGKFKDANQKKIIPVSSIQTGSVNGHDKDVSIPCKDVMVFITNE